MLCHCCETTLWLNYLYRFEIATILTIVTLEVRRGLNSINRHQHASSGSQWKPALRRLANRRHGWTPSDASARLVEEGLRRSEFAFIDFRDSSAGRQACIQGSTLAVWEIMMLVRSYKTDLAATARYLQWPLAKVKAAANYAEAFPEEIDQALAENDATDFMLLKRMLPQASEFSARKSSEEALACSNFSWTSTFHLA